MSLCAHVFRLQFWDPCWFHVISQTSVCMWFKQGFFCHIVFGNMSESFELVEGMEELYFGADQVSIPESDDSAGRASITWNHMCMNLRMVRMPQVLGPILR